MGTAGTSSGFASCSSLPFQTSCGSSERSRLTTNGCALSVAANGAVSRVGMFGPLSVGRLCASTGTDAGGFGFLLLAIAAPLGCGQHVDRAERGGRSFPKLFDLDEAARHLCGHVATAAYDLLVCRVVGNQLDPTHRVSLA